MTGKGIVVPFPERDGEGDRRPFPGTGRGRGRGSSSLSRNGTGKGKGIVVPFPERDGDYGLPFSDSGCRFQYRFNSPISVTLEPFEG